jgi:hypothetical protein
MKTYPSIAVSRARVLNNAADALRPFHAAPAPLRSNAIRHGGAWEGDAEPEELSPAAKARLARILRPAPAPATLAQGFQPRPTSDYVEKKLMLPTGRFKTLKKGPRAGQRVEEQAMIKIGTWSIHCTDGTTYSFGTRSSRVTVTFPGRDKLKLSPDACRATFRRIFAPDVASRAIDHLLGG